MSFDNLRLIRLRQALPQVQRLEGGFFLVTMPDSLQETQEEPQLAVVFSLVTKPVRLREIQAVVCSHPTTNSPAPEEGYSEIAVTKVNLVDSLVTLVTPQVVPELGEDYLEDLTTKLDKTLLQDLTQISTKKLFSPDMVYLSKTQLG